MEQSFSVAAANWGRSPLPAGAHHAAKQPLVWWTRRRLCPAVFCASIERQPVEDVARVYLGQMASYRNLLREIYAGKRVRCALLLTDSADLMELPDGLLDTVLPGKTA